MTLLAAFKVLLHHYSGQKDICVGTAIAGRQQQEVEELIGFFINTLALRTIVNGSDTFNEILAQVKATTLEAYDNQEVPFEKVVDA
jgi:non-ribosomal peptide synthetase component F